MLNTYKTLLNDEISCFKNKTPQNKVYAKKGERVKVISISQPAVIVENSKGNRFPTILNNLL
jgi:hypothetical protein